MFYILLVTKVAFYFIECALKIHFKTQVQCEGFITDIVSLPLYCFDFVIRICLRSSFVKYARPLIQSLSCILHISNYVTVAAPYFPSYRHFVNWGWQSICFGDHHVRKQRSSVSSCWLHVFQYQLLYSIQNWARSSAAFMAKCCMSWVHVVTKASCCR